MKLYISGSYNKHTKYYGWAYIGISELGIVCKRSGKNNIAKNINGIAGELSAIMHAIKDMYEADIKNIDIYYNYIGVCKWACGKWETNNEYTRKYFMYMEMYKKYGMNLRFFRMKPDKFSEATKKMSQLACKT